MIDALHTALGLLLGLLVELALLLDGGVLVLLVLGDQIIHVGLGLSEFHFVLLDNSRLRGVHYIPFGACWRFICRK